MREAQRERGEWIGREDESGEREREREKEREREREERERDRQTDRHKQEKWYQKPLPTVQRKDKNGRFILHQSMCSMSLVLLIHTISILVDISP